MKRVNYIKPACEVILLKENLMESMPTGVSGTTSSGDPDQTGGGGGGGLAKPGFGFDPDEDEIYTVNDHAWEDD